MGNMGENPKTIALNLRRLRAQHIPKLSQAHLARNLRVSRSSYALYELGKRIPKAPVLYRAAQYFGVTVEELLTEPIVVEERGEKARKREKS